MKKKEEKVKTGEGILCFYRSLMWGVMRFSCGLRFFLVDGNFRYRLSYQIRWLGLTRRYLVSDSRSSSYKELWLNWEISMEVGSELGNEVDSV